MILISVYPDMIFVIKKARRNGYGYFKNVS
jgi:hypothetical protein